MGLKSREFGGDPDANDYIHPNRHPYSDSYAYGYCYNRCRTDRHANANRHANPYPHANIHSHPDLYAYGDANDNGDTHTRYLPTSYSQVSAAYPHPDSDNNTNPNGDANPAHQRAAGQRGLRDRRGVVYRLDAASGGLLHRGGTQRRPLYAPGHHRPK